METLYYRICMNMIQPSLPLPSDFVAVNMKSKEEDLELERKQMKMVVEEWRDKCNKAEQSRAEIELRLAELPRSLIFLLWCFYLLLFPFHFFFNLS